MGECHEITRCTAFEGTRRIAAGDLRHVALKTKDVMDRGDFGPILIFDDVSSEPIELDFRGTSSDVLERLAKKFTAETRTGALAGAESEEPRKAGRPKLGVVAREVTLLPRHWDWLNGQPGGASVALRKLVEEARRVNVGKDRLRQAQESAYRFMSAMAGNEPGFEDATRALFAGNADAFQARVDGWPADVRDHARKLAATAFRERPVQPAVVPFPSRRE